MKQTVELVTVPHVLICLQLARHGPVCSVPLLVGYMSLRPGFIASRVHCVQGSLRPRFCVCNFMHTKNATLLQLLCKMFGQLFRNCFFQLFCQKKMQLVLQLVATKKLLTVAKSCQKMHTVAKTVLKSCNTLAKSCKKKLHKSCKHIEPRTQ